MSYSEYSGPIVEYVGTSQSRGIEKIHQGCQSDVLHSKDANTSTQDNKCSIQVQCDGVSSSAKDPAPADLRRFLDKVSPMVLHGLNSPMPAIEWTLEPENEVKEGNLILKPYTTVTVKNAGNEKEDRKFLSVWLSTAPLLAAITWTPRVHTLFCDHPLEQIYLISNSSNTIKIPIRACVSVLYACEHVKNVLSAGTVLGDIYIWRISRKQGEYSYVELLCQALGDGVITTLNWFKPVNDKSLLISGHIDGQINSYIYDGRHDTVSVDKSYTTADSADGLSPISIIEIISETSFCLYRRGCPLMMYDLNNYVPNKKKDQNPQITLAGKECKGVDALMEIISMHYKADCDFDYPLLIATKQGDVFGYKIKSGVFETATRLFRSPYSNIRSVVLMSKPIRFALFQKLNGDIQLFDIDSGKESPVLGNRISHMSVSPAYDDDIYVLMKRSINEEGQQGTVEIFSLLEDER